MKKYKYTVALLALVMSACSNYDEIEDLAQSSNSLETISASIAEAPASRVVIGDEIVDENGKAIRPVKWRAADKDQKIQADQILVFGTEGAARYDYAGTEDALQGVFKHEATSTKITDFSEALCYNLIGNDWKNVKGINGFPLQSMRFHSQSVENAVMYGKKTADGQLQFYQTMGMVELIVPQLYNYKAGVKPSKIYVKILTDQPIATKGNATSGTTNNLFAIRNTEDPTKAETYCTVDLSNPNVQNWYQLYINCGLLQNPGTKLYFPLPVGQYGFLQFEIYYEKLAPQNLVAYKIVKASNGGSVNIEKKMYSISFSDIYHANFDQSTQFNTFDSWINKKLTSLSDGGWYHRCSTSKTSAVTVDGAWLNLKSNGVTPTAADHNIVFKTKNSLNINADYSLDFVAKTNKASKSDKLNVLLSSSNDDKFFAVQRFSTPRNQVTLTDKEDTYSIPFDLNQYYLSGFPVTGTSTLTPQSDSAPTDVAGGVNIYFFNDGTDGDVMIKDIRLVKINK